MSQRARTRGRRLQLQCIRRALRFPLIGLLLVVAVGCSSNKTQTISESYVQSVVNLNNGLALHVGDVTRVDQRNDSGIATGRYPDSPSGGAKR